MAITQTAPTELAQLSDLGFAFHLDQRSDEIADKLGQEGYELADSLFAAVGEAVERLSMFKQRMEWWAGIKNKATDATATGDTATDGKAGT